MRKHYIFYIVIVCMMLLQLLVFCVLVRQHDNDFVRFSITERSFLQAVDHSVSNFLCRVVSNEVEITTTGSLSVSSDPLPVCVVVDDLSTWLWPSCGCIIDGVRYTVGDYTDYGLIRRIDSGKVYCTVSNVVNIVRGRSRARSPERARDVPGNIPRL